MESHACPAVAGGKAQAPAGSGHAWRQRLRAGWCSGVSQNHLGSPRTDPGDHRS